MGGQSKKSGKGGGGGGKNDARRNCLPAARKQVNHKNSDVPGSDLRRAGEKLLKTNNGYQRRILNIPTLNAKMYKQENAPAPETAEEEAAVNASQMAAFALSAAQRRQQYQNVTSTTGLLDHNGREEEMGPSMDDASMAHKKDISLKRFYKEFQKVVETADVLLEVIDARDPMGCRLETLEQQVQSQWGDHRKKIVLVLNKCDLVPSKVVDKWVEYLCENTNFPCVAFTASTDAASQKEKGEAIGNLFKLLRVLAKGDGGGRKHITVGTIGYPNVGKSSIINALKRKHVVGVGNTPGFTTGNTEVELRSDIRIMDCPGVVMPGEGQGNGDIVLRNAIKVDQLENPIIAVKRLVERCDPGQLATVYEIGTFFTVEDFVNQVGMRRGRLRQNGLIDDDETCKIILKDWNDGRIGYFTLPPGQENTLNGITNLVAKRKEKGEAEDEDEGEAQVFTVKSSGINLCPLPTFHLCVTEASTGKRKNAKRHTAAYQHHVEEEYDEEDEEEYEDEEGAEY